MSYTSLSLGRRVLVTTALGLFICIVIVISQTTKSKWWLLGLLALLPISILAFLVDRYVLRPESPDLAAELPLPVVAIRRTRAPETTATTGLRACQSLPTPSAQSLCTIAFRYITVFDQTVSRLYLFRHALDSLVDVRLAISAETRASIATVLNGLREREDTTLQRLASSLELGLVPGQRLAPVERLAIGQPQDLVSIPVLSSSGGDYPQARTPLNEALPTSPATSLANANSITPPPNTKASAALSPTLPSIVLTPSEKTSSAVIFDSTSGCVDQKTKGLAPARNPSDGRHSTVTLAASVSGSRPPTIDLGISSLPFPSLPEPAEDHGRTITNADSLVSTPDGTNALGIVLSDPAGRIVSDACSLGPVKCAVDPISVPFKRSRKMALKAPKLINHAEWTRKSCYEVTTAITLGTATNTPPHLSDASMSSPSPSSNGGNLSSTVSSWPPPTPSTPPTSIDQQPDHHCEAGAPSSPLDSKLEPLNDAEVLDTEATAPEAPEGKIEGTIAWWRHNVPFKSVQGSRRNRHRRRRFGCNASTSPTDEDWKWAKTDGKKPLGGRRPMVVTRPAQPTTFVHSDAVDDGRGAGDFEEEELQKAILMSMDVVLEDGEADAEASPNSKHLGSQLVEGTCKPLEVIYVDHEGFPVNDLEKALKESMSELQTTAPTVSEEDDLDEDGFSKSQQQQAREASRP
ncbi:hypothetical protein FS837_009371, partial [Tulasnella sp. UAMH 9824]